MGIVSKTAFELGGSAVVGQKRRPAHDVNLTEMTYSGMSGWGFQDVRCRAKAPMQRTIRQPEEASSLHESMMASKVAGGAWESSLTNPGVRDSRGAGAGWLMPLVLMNVDRSRWWE